MSDLDLRPFASRFRALVDSSPPETLAETRAWVVGPLLDSLGWNGDAESCRTDVTVDETAFEYACLVESVPALFVAVEPFPAPLDRDRASEIYRTMVWTGVDRAIYTNGRQALLFAGTSDVDHVECRMAEIVDYESAFDHFTRDALERRLERHERDHVARQLALERATLADAIVDRLTDATDGTYEREFAAATDRFLDGLVTSFADDVPLPPAAETDGPDDGVAIRFSDPTVSMTDAADATDRPPEAADDATDASGSPDDTDGTTADGPDRSVRPASNSATDEDGGAERTTTPNADAGTTDETEANAAPDGDGDDITGEYVVRFFAERGSIGAIGHSTSTNALVHAAEYCLDRGLAGVSVPWSPSDGDETVLNDEPVHADGTPMTAAERLSNGLYLNTGGTVADRAARVEDLANRSGLRAMVTGDWDTDQD
ncbi:hypothetical protein [Halosolutus gelatinilyticus]|uniref:hypothetical protein n=1 Tax=Halosolutus gelatinilyticus TaxID=2931975 RepID=UPI001FF1BE79|nr:hypothetical protein [Halosolutus gelatinilyticus]